MDNYEHDKNDILNENCSYDGLDDYYDDDDDDNEDDDDDNENDAGDDNFQL